MLSKLFRLPRMAGIVLLAVTVNASASELDDFVTQQIEKDADVYSSLARDIWGWAEMGYQEVQSSGALQAQLRDAGFRIEAGVADIPTAFVASYGRGKPVIGILAEFDALPGLSQEATAERMPIPGSAAGHACGHHLFGTGSTAAAIVISRWMEANGSEGTIRLYGTPAEEGGAGKVYMVRAGLFDDIDAMLQWHPGDRNQTANFSSLANKSAKFRFHGRSSHAAASPENGRSALDAVEAMNYMVNMMREHVPSDTRIHYVITEGGNAPNVVPDFAEVFYYVRSPTATTLASIWPRVELAAKAAAMGTETRLETEIIHGVHGLLANVRLGKVIHESLQAFGGIQYSPDEARLAESLYATYQNQASRDFVTGQRMQLGSEQTVFPHIEDETAMPGSTDVGDVSWVVPTAGMLSTATWVPGTSAHSWQAVAAGGSGIGSRGMLLAAKILARTGIKLLSEPGIVEEAKVEFDRRRGPDFVYESLLGDRQPPLDYRN